MFVFTVEDPGPWQSFSYRPDNIGLPVHILSEKYLVEQLMFADQYSQFIAYQNWLNVQAAGQAEQTPENTPEQEIVTEAGVALVTETGEYIITT